MPAKSVKPAKTVRSRKKSVLTDLSPAQETIANAVLDGKTMGEAAQLAGCTPRNAAAVVKHSADVQQYLEMHRSELSSAVQIKRADVIAGVMEAIELARLAADPASMIRGWSEIGKMLGVYAPEVKKIEFTAGQRNIQSKYEVMNDEELLAIAEGTVNVIEGEFQRG
jgi:DNA-binding CsgD family transcriptional regulator